MNEWDLFQNIFNVIGPPVLAAVNGVVAALQGWMRPWIVAAVALSVTLKGLQGSLTGRSQSGPLNDVLHEAVIAGVIAWMACGAAGLGPQARDLMLNVLSREIGQAAVTSIGSRPMSAGLFDDLWNRAFTAGLDVYNALPAWSPKAWALSLVIVAYWFIALPCIGIGFLVWISAFLLTATCVALWPLGVAAFAFTWTRGFGWGWMRATVTNIILGVLVVILLGIGIGAMTRILSDLQAGIGTTGLRNEIREIRALLGAVMILGFLAWTAKQLPGLASSMGHGFTGYGQFAFLQVFGGMMGGGTPGTGTGTPGTAGTQGAPAPTSPVPRGTPPGRAIS